MVLAHKRCNQPRI